MIIKINNYDEVCSLNQQTVHADRQTLWCWTHTAEAPNTVL